jgi:hypothetical protein
MKQKCIIIALVLVVFGSVYGQEKVYFDAEGNETLNVKSAVEYIITEKEFHKKRFLV